MRLIGLAVIGIILSGCAQRPDEIKPTVATDLPYRGMNCQQLRAEFDKVNLELFRVGRKQHAKAEHDAIGYFAIGVLGTVGGGEDQAPAISGMIGQLDAISGVAKFKNCPPMPQKASELHFQDIPPEQDHP